MMMMRGVGSPRVAVLLVGIAGCSGDIAEPQSELTAVINGSAHSVDEGDLSSLWAFWRPANGTASDSAQLSADGRFRIEVRTTDTAGHLQIGDAAATTYHPFLYPFDLGDLANIDVVMIPRMWKIQRGEYEGQSILTALDVVVNDDADRTFYTYFQGQPYPRSAPELYLLDLMSWPEENMPAKVAIDRLNFDQDLTAADSASIWHVLNRMEAVLGLDLFEPVVADPSWWPFPTGPFDGERIPGVIRITAQAPGWRAVVQSSDDPAVWDQDLGAWADEGRFASFRVKERYLDGGSLVLGAFEPFQLADGLIAWETVMTHEMLHLLGAGHTCRMESPMGPCDRSAEASPYDVAYLELLRETMRLQRELPTPYGIMPAVIGERRLQLGLPALPELND